MSTSIILGQFVQLAFDGSLWESRHFVASLFGQYNGPFWVFFRATELNDFLQGFKY